MLDNISRRDCLRPLASLTLLLVLLSGCDSDTTAAEKDKAASASRDVNLATYNARYFQALDDEFHPLQAMWYAK